MKVLHISYSDMGGAGIAAIRLHRFLLGEGIDSRFLCKIQRGTFTVNLHHIKPRKSSAFSLQKISRYIGIGTDRDRPEWMKQRPPGFEHFSLAGSGEQLNENPLVQDADLIHLHWVADDLLDPALFFRIKKPVLWTLHDMNPFTGGCHHADGCHGFQEDCAYCPQLSPPWNKNLAQRNLAYKIRGLASTEAGKLHVVTPSAWLGSLSRKSRLFGAYEHSVIPNLTDDHSFYPRDRESLRQKYGIGLQEKVIFFAANDVANPRKGINTLLDSLSGKKDITLLTAGGRLEAPAGLNVRHMDFTTDPEIMAEFYSLADLFVLPSLAENFPNTIVEALYCGVPVIAAHTGGIPEMINSSNGKLFLPGDVKGLAEAIGQVLLNPALYDRTKISQQCRENYNSRRAGQQYIGAYMKILGT
jgi:glycosyltransferase involved in cell wall biosynthesis